jgi:ferredoxin
MPISRPTSPVSPLESPTPAVSRVFSARLEPDGSAFEAPASLTLLQAAEKAGLQMASSCRNGTCRYCLCQLMSGQVSYRIEWPGLSADEKREGCILPCVAYPTSDVVMVLPR